MYPGTSFVEACSIGGWRVKELAHPRGETRKLGVAHGRHGCSGLIPNGGGGISHAQPGAFGEGIMPILPLGVRKSVLGLYHTSGIRDGDKGVEPDPGASILLSAVEAVVRLSSELTASILLRRGSRPQGL